MSEKICVPQAACAGVDIGGRRYTATNGVMTVDNPAHARIMREQMECFPSSAPTRAEGFVCTSCGFHAVFRKCGRCGGACVRPSELHEETITP